MLNNVEEFLKYYLSEKVLLFKIGNAIYTCDNNADYVEDMCGWKFRFSERFQIFMFFAIGLSIIVLLREMVESIKETDYADELFQKDCIEMENALDELTAKGE